MLKTLKKILTREREPEVRYVWDSPRLVTKNTMCLLPFECWEEKERDSLRYCVKREKRVRGRWILDERLEFTRAQLMDRLAIWEITGN